MINFSEFHPARECLTGQGILRRTLFSLALSLAAVHKSNLSVSFLALGTQ